jgi:hypothetical protein
MFKRSWILIGALLLGAATAQAQDTPEDAARDFYEVLFSGQEEDFARLQQGLCRYYTYRDYEYLDFIAALDGASVDLSDVEFSVEDEVDDNTVILSVEGEIGVSGGEGGTPVIEFPFTQLTMFNEGGRWKPCPTDRLISVIRVSDLELSEDDAYTTALQFYNAFYTGDAARMETLTCLAAREKNLEGMGAELSGTYEMTNSAWTMEIVQQGYDYRVQTEGTLTLLAASIFVEEVNDRIAFSYPIVIRENGWKFCDSYRSVHRDVEAFARAYFGDAPPEEVMRYVCPNKAEEVAESSGDYSLAITSVNLPDSIARRVDSLSGTVEPVNLRSVVVISDDDAVSVGRVFGDNVLLERWGNGWRWCPQPEEETEEAE